MDDEDLGMELERQLTAHLLDMTQQGQHLMKLSELYQIIGQDPPWDFEDMDLRIIDYGDNTVGLENAQNRKNLH